MSDSLPLLASRDLAQPLAWRGGKSISGAQFIAEAQLLARELPAGDPVNLCQDRYHFALGLAAALLRGQTSLMPPNALPETLDHLEGVAPYLLVDFDGVATGRLPTFRVHRPADVVLPPGQAQPVPRIAADLLAVRLLTSGSTGTPQPHAKRWDSLVANIAAQAQRLSELLRRPSLAGLALVGTVPAQHSYGFESSVLLALLGGASFEAERPFFPADISAALQRVPAPRALVTTPFHLKTVLLAGLPLPPVALVLSATAPLSPQMAAQAEAVFGGLLVEIYGCTEAGQVASRRTTAGLTWCTLGELRITRQGGLQADASEQFIVAGGHVPQPTPLADVLELQDERHFRLLGRANDLIHVAGKRSSLAHLNFHLNSIAGVVDGAFWLPDEVTDGVVRPVAFVVAPGVSAREVIAGLRGVLDSAFLPRRVVHVEALPREATGKLTAAALRRFALHQLSPPAPDAEFDIAANHPALAGHFAGHPVLPGACLLSLVMQALAAQPALAGIVGQPPCIESAKFLRQVVPGQRLRVALRAQRSGVAFDIWHGATAVARGQFAAQVRP